MGQLLVAVAAEAREIVPNVSHAEAEGYGGNGEVSTLHGFARAVEVERDGAEYKRLLKWYGRDVIEGEQRENAMRHTYHSKAFRFVCRQVSGLQALSTATSAQPPGLIWFGRLGRRRVSEGEGRARHSACAPSPNRSATRFEASREGHSRDFGVWPYMDVRACATCLHRPAYTLTRLVPFWAFANDPRSG